MAAFLWVEQAINGIQLGIMLFLISAGLTLVFGIMNLLNIAHGALYMLGAYLFAAVFNASGSYLQAMLAALIGTMLIGMLIELSAFRRLYERTHLDQVLATFGITMFFNELVRVIWGPTALYASVPSFLAGQVMVLPGIPYPIYRLFMIAAGIIAAGLLFILISYTRIGMLIRAGASNRVMVNALGVNIKLLYTIVFGVGAALAALAGAMAGPILAVEFGYGQ